MNDKLLKFFDEADISTSPTSDVIRFPESADTALTGALPRIADNMNGAFFFNVEVNADITGAEVVALHDSADGSSYAATTTSIAVGAASAGDVFSMAIPSTVRAYLKAVETVGTAGTITVSLGKKLPNSLV